MKKFFGFACLLLVPATASAHVKWFVDSAAVTAARHGEEPFYYLTSAEVVAWSAIGFLLVVVAALLSRVLPEPRAVAAFAARNRRAINRAAQAVLGLFLVTVALVWNLVLVPEFPVTGGWSTWLWAAQIISGLMLIANVWPRVGAAILVALHLAVGVEVGFAALAENVLLAGLAFYFLVNDSPARSPLRRLDRYGVEVVRISVGVSLIVLALTEKLMYPELSLAFLGNHGWNFMPALGFDWFTDKLFVLSTGFVELVFGVVFILGYVTRINTATIAAFFAASVVTMLVQVGAWEVEDLAVYSAAIILLAFGAGPTRFFCKKDCR
jgi:hypothetical protein